MSLLFAILITITTYSYSYNMYAPKSQSSLTLEILEKEIQENQIKSISALLAQLKIKYPNYIKNFVVVFRSLSLQEASLENPRILIFGEDASLVISFNGSAKQRGYANVEVMSFDKVKKEFSFHEITFLEDQNERRRQVELAELDVLEQEVLTDTKHLHQVTSPPVCLTCHTPFKKPNWETYPNWPGVYGGFDDKTTGEVQSNPKERLAHNAVYQGANQLLAVIDRHPRYQHLTGLKSYLEEILGQGMFGSAKQTPNLLFTEFLAHLNFERLFYRITQLNNYEKYKLAVPAALYYCLSDETHFKNIFGPNYFHSDLKQKEVDIQNRIFRNRKLKRDQVIEFEQPQMSDLLKTEFYSYNQHYGVLHSDDRPFAHLSFLVENVLNDTMMFDSMSFNPGSYDFTIGSSHHHVAKETYLRVIQHQDPELFKRIRLAESQSKNFKDTCDHFLRK